MKLFSSIAKIKFYLFNENYLDNKNKALVFNDYQILTKKNENL